MPATKEWLRAATTARPIGVDRERNVIQGYVVAETGVFKDERGEFDGKAMKELLKLMKAEKAGLKSRFGHPSLSDDGLGKYIGRAKNPWLEVIEGKNADGNAVEHQRLRADLHIAAVAMEEPVGGGMPLGEYVMRRAEEDPDSFGSSLVLTTEQEYRIDRQGRPLTNENGEAYPPLWRPTALHASDVVDTGDAVNSFLAVGAVDALPDAAIRRGCELLDQQFAGKPRAFVAEHLSRFANRYLEWRYGPEEPAPLVTTATTADSPVVSGATVTVLDPPAPIPATPEPIPPDRDPRLAEAKEWRKRHGIDS